MRKQENATFGAYCTLLLAYIIDLQPKKNMKIAGNIDIFDWMVIMMIIPTNTSSRSSKPG